MLEEIETGFAHYCFVIIGYPYPLNIAIVLNLLLKLYD